MCINSMWTLKNTHAIREEQGMKFPVSRLSFLSVWVGIAGPHQLNSCQNFSLLKQINNIYNTHTHPQILSIQRKKLIPSTNSRHVTQGPTVLEGIKCSHRYVLQSCSQKNYCMHAHTLDTRDAHALDTRDAHTYAKAAIERLLTITG